MFIPAVDADPGTSYAGDVICPYYTQAVSLELQQGFSLWGGGSEFAGFGTLSSYVARKVRIASVDLLTSSVLYNNTFDFYSLSEGGFLTGKYSSAEFFYYRGTVFSDAEVSLFN